MRQVFSHSLGIASASGFYSSQKKFQSVDFLITELNMEELFFGLLAELLRIVFFAVDGNHTENKSVGGWGGLKKKAIPEGMARFTDTTVFRRSWQQ